MHNSWTIIIIIQLFFMNIRLTSLLMIYLIWLIHANLKSRRFSEHTDTKMWHFKLVSYWYHVIVWWEITQFSNSIFWRRYATGTLLIGRVRWSYADIRWKMHRAWRCTVQLAYWQRMSNVLLTYVWRIGNAYRHLGVHFKIVIRRVRWSYAGHTLAIRYDYAF